MEYQTAIVSIFVPVIAGLGLTWWLTKRRSAYKDLPPGLPSMPVFGSLPFSGLLWNKDAHIGLTNLAKKYGDIYHFWTGNTLTVALNNYSLIRQALVDNAVELAGRPGWDLSGYNPNHLGIADPTYTLKWKHDRNLSLSVLKDFGFGKTLMEDRIVEEVETLLSHLDELQNEELNPQRILQVSVSNVICSIVLGKHFEHDDEQFLRLIVGTEKFMATYLEVVDSDYVPVLNLLPSVKRSMKKFHQSHDQVQDLLRKYITEHKQHHVEGDNSDFIHAYLDKVEEEENDEESLLYIVRDLFMAGTETTATFLRWAMLYMANYPDIQSKVQEELDGVLISGGPASLKDKANLPYTEAVIQEVQRLAAVAPQGVPHETLDDVTIDGYLIPKGTLILCNLWAVLRDPELWPEPDKLKPERFLTDDGKVLHRPELISFSLGRRACLGEILARQEMFLFFASLLHKYNIRKPDGVDRLDETGRSMFTRVPREYTIVISNRH